MHRMREELSITLKWAQTIDGQLADDQDQSQWISGKEERRYTHLVRSRHDAVLVGAQTFLKDRCKLTVREGVPCERQPARVILDPKGRVKEAARSSRSLRAELATGGRRTYLLTDVDSDPGFHVPGLVQVRYRLETLESWLDGSLYLLRQQFALQERRELRRIMVEGGASTLSLFLRAGIAERLEISVSPLILGGDKHRVRSAQLLANASRFRLVSQERLGADVVLRYLNPLREERKAI